VSSVVVVGTQWGDEGKGKITDFLARKAHMVVRYQGGSNAGHTVVVDGEEFRLHLIPSGILYEDKICVIGNGVVIELGVLVRELQYLQERGKNTSNLRISDNAHLVMPYHRRLDEIEEEQRGEDRLGTTKRGIGPAYRDKAARFGLRVCDLLERETFRKKLATRLEQVNHLLCQVYGTEGFDLEEMEAEFRRYADIIEPHVVDTSLIINQALDAGQNVLFEGAQGTLLDLDHGTYPYVTSSHPTAGGACIGAGVGPTKIDRVIGVTKAYTSRVGDGPFPTELTGETGDWIREKGHEYGTTTGRPRRCGWLDTVILRHAVRVSGLTGLALTRLDTLGGLKEIKICRGYRYRGRLLTEFPHSLDVLKECEPVYEEVPGWDIDISHLTDYDDLPVEAKNYLQRVEELAGVKIDLVSIGRERAQTISLHRVF